MFWETKPHRSTRLDHCPCSSCDFTVVVVGFKRKLLPWTFPVLTLTNTRQVYTVVSRLTLRLLDMFSPLYLLFLRPRVHVQPMCRVFPSFDRNKQMPGVYRIQPCVSSTGFGECVSFLFSPSIIHVLFAQSTRRVFLTTPVFFCDAQDSRAARARGLQARHFRTVLPASPAVAAREGWTLMGPSALARSVRRAIIR